MLPKEIIEKIKRIEIKTSRMVTDVFGGQYHSVFKGRGMEFDEVREYQPGDEIRSIDWNVTARMGHPFVKKFVEERQLTVMLLMDASGSSYFGTQNQLKSEIAAELCAVLAFSAIKNNDRVGLIIFSDRIEKFIPPRKGLRHVLRVVREALYHKPEGKGTDIRLALEYLNQVIRKKAVCFLISDFFSEDKNEGLLQLKITNKRHDLIAVTVTDPAEQALPEAGIIRLEDAETRAAFYVDSSCRAVREAFQGRSSRLLAQRTRMLRQAGVDVIDINTQRPYTEALFRFFRTREKRLRG
ncbi:MAG: DUF58 domain-containing protein [Candidatus Omnitrophica bacterium]|nr:DUF58 domain-containing protein [Candidatus Omnitrophota bacterium]MBU4479706.1 DUF58 domain-containing protein [Candidatus Omnitrophota bacterium]MCG2703504.1 DUF58 domain-containing protein [Candidatus Omnitrophota bacterium]